MPDSNGLLLKQFGVEDGKDFNTFAIQKSVKSQQILF